MTALVKPRKPTFAANAVIPSTKANQAADLADYAANPPACIVTRTATQSLTTAVAALVSFDTQIFDNSSMFTLATNLFPPAGVYNIAGWVVIDANVTGIRVVEVVQNGGIVLSDSRPAPTAADARITVATTLLVVTGDSIGLQAFQNSGGNLNITSARLAVTRQSGS